MAGAESEFDEAAVGRVFRAESGRSVATLIRVFGDIDVAEDAVQEAFAVALRRWPTDGPPPNPGGWITTTARNCAIDRLRRESRGRELLGEVAVLAPDDSDPEPEEAGPVPDDRLRLMFTCCHPALSTEAQVALTLRLLGGLTTEEVARAFAQARSIRRTVGSTPTTCAPRAAMARVIRPSPQPRSSTRWPLMSAGSASSSTSRANSCIADPRWT
jgi:predicted RNA polymerase sigma factor